MEGDRSITQFSPTNCLTQFHDDVRDKNQSGKQTAKCSRSVHSVIGAFGHLYAEMHKGALTTSFLDWQLGPRPASDR